MFCPKCKTDHAHRSHRRGLPELLASVIAIYPYQCRDCALRFHRFRYAAPREGAKSDTVREIRSTRNALVWKRKRREILLYGGAVLFFLAFLYFITRERGASPDGG